jgi:type VI secretion system secreted protein VgrG
VPNAPASQSSQPISLTTPLGPNKLLLENLSGRETLSDLFHFELSLLAQMATDVSFDKLLGQSVTVTLQGAASTARFFNGIVSRMSQGQVIYTSVGAIDYYRYSMDIVPKVWLLTRSSRSRIFQHLSVVDILKKVFTGYDVDYDGLTGTYQPRDFCVQYRETDFQFASRLMEEEGIFYFFKHTKDSHKLYLGDSAQANPDLEAPSKVTFQKAFGDIEMQEQVLTWERIQEIRPGKYTLWDHNFELPDKNLEATQPILETVQTGTVAQKLKVGGNDSLEVYDYPGGYAGRFDGIDKGGGEQSAELQKIFDDNKRTVGIRMQQETVPGLYIAASSSCRRFYAGAKFTLDKHFNANGPYVLTMVEHTASVGNAFLVGEVPEVSYSNAFRCIPAAMPFRPERSTPRPFVHGTQTAVVVGNSGEEITTDKYGRVKVQFFWDRDGQKNLDSSCWVRVGSIWAGQQWGAIHIPRVGHEVIVAFLEGDPDQPIIVGSVYNAQNMPPYTLPDNRTQSGLKSRSSLQGTDTNFNELRFEDKKDSEQIYFHAEKDFIREVENNDSLTVGSSDSKTCPDGSQTISIYKDRTETVETGNELVTIKKGTRTIDVDTGNDTHNVKQGNREVNVNTGTDTINVKTGDRTLNVDTGNRTVNVKTGNDAHNVKTGNRSVTISMGNDSLTISMGNQTTKLNLGASSTEAMQSITLKVGANSLKIDQTGITLQGIMIKIQANALLQAKAPMTQVNGDGILMLKGGVTMIN